MGGVFQDLEAAGQRRRRERVFVAIGITGALIFATLFVFRDVGYFLLSVYAVALPIRFVVESWLGLTKHDPTLSFPKYLTQQAVNGLILAAAFAAAFWSRRKTAFEWNDLIVVFAAFAMLFVRAVYRWRESHRATNLDFLGSGAQITMLSRPALSIHLASYAIGIAAALAVSAVIDKDWWNPFAYAIAFLIGKLASDLLWPLPASLAAGRPSRMLAKITALSPLLWGVPWGLFVAVYFLLFIWHPKPDEIPGAALDTASLALGFAVAVPLVFATLTAVTFLFELLTGTKDEIEDEDLPSNRFWTLHFWAVVSLALAGFLFLIKPLPLTDEEVFGEEKWTCGKKYDEYQVAWIGRSGVEIAFKRYSIDLFNISCVPTSADRRFCEYDDEGWEEITILVTKAGDTETIVFNRKTPGVQSNYRHHADIYGDLVDTIAGAFRTGTSAKMIIRAGKGRVLYDKLIDLKDFTKAHNACQARWG